MARISRTHRPRRIGVVVLVVVAAATAVVATTAGAATKASPPQNTSAPTISGSAQQGSTLTASPGSWSGATPITYSYHWLRCNKHGDNCNGISGAKQSTYQLRDSDVGHVIRVQVTASNADGSGQATSGPTAEVGGAQGPKNTSRPTISGTALEGGTLTASAGSWSGTTPITYQYEWRRCGPGGGNCDSIGGATGSTYHPTADDVAHTLRVRVTARNNAGSNDADSAATSAIDGPPALDRRPSIAGTPSVGQRLDAGNGTWRSTSHITFSFQWDRCDSGGNNCVQIPGATSPTYVVVAADTGHTLTFVVRAQNARGTTLAEAKPSGVVGGAPPPPSSAIPVAQVSLPDRLVIDKLVWSPPRIRSRQQALVGRFHVSEVNHGRSVSGALVYGLGVPFGQLSNAPEVVTDASGWATITFSIRPALPLRRGYYVVVFLRARKPGENLLAGVSTRRLVSVQVG
jgi:hypothetical protein